MPGARSCATSLPRWRKPRASSNASERSAVNVTDRLSRWPRARPDADALVRPDGSTIAWRDLDRAVDAHARGCAALGVRAGEVVMLAVLDAHLLLLLQLGLMRLGAAPTPPT